MESNESQPVQFGWRRGDDPDALLTREWLVTKALGGYASGTIGGACTRRFHGLLIAALPAPLSRTMMFNHLEEWIETKDGVCWRLSADEQGGGAKVGYPEADFLEEFTMECGLPVWRYEKNGIRIEKRVVMPHLQNTTYVFYKLVAGPPDLTLNLRPSLHFRPHEGLLSSDVSHHWTVTTNGDDIEISDNRDDYPTLRVRVFGAEAKLDREERVLQSVIYRIERSRGYESEGPLWSPGVIRITLAPRQEAGFIASVESWDVIRALAVTEACEAETARRNRLLTIAGPDGQENFAAQLILAADQFLIRPRPRAADEARATAVGDEPRTVIAGYHWFTDWGRDTMISLEGLTLVTSRHREAGNIIRTFASYIRDGLIPNMFPEGEHGGL